MMKIKPEHPARPVLTINDSDGGFGLACNGNILAHGGNLQVNIYDLKMMLNDPSKQGPLYTIQIDSAVNGLAFSPFYPEICAVVADDGQLLVVDSSDGSVVARTMLGDFCDGFVGCSICFHQFNESVVAIGGDDGSVMIFNIASQQMINTKHQVHTSAIYQI